MRSLKDCNLKYKTVLVRVDFNVPVDKKGKIADDSRIKNALPTIKHLISQKAIILLMTHIGRPKGKVDEALRTDKVAERLQKLLKKKVMKADDCIGPGVLDKINELIPGEILVLENVRFHAGETANDEYFAQSLAELADIYVNDAFGASHREHASVVGITEHLPSCAGMLLEKEIKMLSMALKPKKPSVAILGGAKLSTKLSLIRYLLKKFDKVLLGGAMITPFYKAKGYEVGKSLIEKDFIAKAKLLLKNKKLILPEDVLAGGKAITPDKVSKSQMILDIGPETVKTYNSILKKAKTIVWNGPMGKFEDKKYAKGTNAVAKTISKCKGTTIVGGGDTVDAINRLKLAKKFTHVSTGGGASMEFMEKGILPAIKALNQNQKTFKRV